MKVFLEKNVRKFSTASCTASPSFHEDFGLSASLLCMYVCDVVPDRVESSLSLTGGGKSDSWLLLSCPPLC